MKKINLILIFYLFTVLNIKANYKIVGYFANWAQYRSHFNCKPQDLDPTKLTAINYAFGYFNYNKLLSTVTNDWAIYPIETNDINELYPQLENLKSSNSDLETFLSIGGATFCANVTTKTFFHDLCANTNYQDLFINSAIIYCATHGFNGIDLDWEFPAKTDHGGDNTDYQNFYDFLKNFRTTLNNQNSNLKITMAAPPSVPYLSTNGSYSINGNVFNVDTSNPSTYFLWLYHCSEYLDWINIMTYDYYGAGWQDYTADNAPLYSHPDSHYNSISKTVDYYINSGISKDKLILGMPAYARTYKTVAFDSTWDLPNHPYGPGSGPNPSVQGDAGYLTLSPGYLSYIEVHKALKYDGSFDDMKYNSNTGTSYAWNAIAATWITFDSPNNVDYLNGELSSLELKVKFIMENQLGGAMIWSLDQDLYKQFSGLTDPINPFLNTIYNTFNSEYLSIQTFLIYDWLTQDLTYKISWNIVSAAVKYKLYRKANHYNLILETQNTYYFDHNRNPSEINKYYLTYIDSNEEEHDLGSITL